MNCGIYKMLSPRKKAFISWPQKGKGMISPSWTQEKKNSASGPGSIQCSNIVLDKTSLMLIQSSTIWQRQLEGYLLLLSLQCMEHTEHLTGVSCEEELFIQNFKIGKENP